MTQIWGSNSVSSQTLKEITQLKFKTLKYIQILSTCLTWIDSNLFQESLIWKLNYLCPQQKRLYKFKGSHRTNYGFCVSELTEQTTKKSLKSSIKKIVKCSQNHNSC